MPSELALLEELKVLLVAHNPLRSIRKDIVQVRTRSYSSAHLKRTFQRGTAELLKHLRMKLDGTDCFGSPSSEPSESVGARPVSANSVLSPRVVEMITRNRAMELSNRQLEALPAELLRMVRKGEEVEVVDLSRNAFKAFPEE